MLKGFTGCEARCDDEFCVVAASREQQPCRLNCDSGLQRVRPAVLSRDLTVKRGDANDELCSARR